MDILLHLSRQHACTQPRPKPPVAALGDAFSPPQAAIKRALIDATQLPAETPRPLDIVRHTGLDLDVKHWALHRSEPRSIGSGDAFRVRDQACTPRVNGWLEQRSQR